MRVQQYKQSIQKLLDFAGITLNGNEKWDIRVSNEKFYHRVFCHGSLGLGESYMEGWWECDQLDDFFYRLLRARLNEKIKKDWKLVIQALSARILNRQSRRRAFIIGRHHYDTGNELFHAMLDKGMNYSCGYWKETDSLDEAQRNKLDLICRKLELKEGMRVLDIGCGWGGFAKFAAEQYGTKVLGITVSRQQADFAREFCQGLPIEIRLQDYRLLNEKFDRVVSIGMFEHVGYKNYHTYMKAVHHNLTDDGLFLLHTIGGNRSVKNTDPWIEKYIFPNSMLPSIKQIGKAIEGLFVMEDWHNFGPYYDQTLMAWHRNFEERWPEIQDKYDDRFYRMWKYYLLSCAGSFRARENQLWQVVLSKGGVTGGLPSIR